MPKKRTPTTGAVRAPAKRQGETSAAQSEGPVPKLPHERDESASHTASPPRKRIKSAHDDVARGAVDTDRGPVTDATYQKQKK